jgi:uncharacterized membrane protein SpoIIM required for sporulation
MILDLPRFVAVERPFWEELERYLNRIEAEPNWILSLDELQRFHWLYERAAADLARIMTFSADPETREFLENLVTRAYGEVHESRSRHHRLRPLHWLFQTWPTTFRRHMRAFVLSLAITLIGCVFGAGAVAFDPEAKAVIMPFPHLLGDPAERVAQEERAMEAGLHSSKTSFSTQLMTHNTKVSIFALALGMTWGVGTILLLFYNGVILGAVVLDYVRAGQTPFLLGWLLPHGAVEIPAILMAGQAGLILAGALIGWGNRARMGTRLRQISPDLVTLIVGVALLLVWAGFVEAFLSQYHAPVFPYWAKITFGTVELVLLFLFLTRSGSNETEERQHAAMNPAQGVVGQALDGSQPQ